MKRSVTLDIVIVLAATTVAVSGQWLPGLYLTNAVVLSNGFAQFEVRVPEPAKPFALLYSYAKDFCYLRDSQRWSALCPPLDSGANRYTVTLPQPIAVIGTIFFRAAPLGQPIYWLESSITTAGALSNGSGVVTWPRRPDGWHVTLTVQNSTNFPATNEVLFTGPPGTVTNAPAEDFSGGCYKGYYRVNGPGSLPPPGTWNVQYATQAFTFAMADSSGSYAVMVPTVVVSNGLLTSVSWTYHDPTSGAVLATPPAHVAGSRSVWVSGTNGSIIYDSPPADRGRTSHLFESAIMWSELKSFSIGFHDDRGNTFSFEYYR